MLGGQHWQYWAVDQKMRAGKCGSQAPCQITGRSSWNKCDDVNSEGELIKRKKDGFGLRHNEIQVRGTYTCVHGGVAEQTVRNV